MGTGASTLGGYNPNTPPNNLEPVAVHETGRVEHNTAQVAVSNIPVDWSHIDIERICRAFRGFLGAQVLFNGDGSSKRVGVGLFADGPTADTAARTLSGVEASGGLKLKLVCLSPRNHVSFDCRQVVVVGLPPSECTAASVLGLIEAAAVAAGEPASEAGVEAVEVPETGGDESQGRAIVTFKSPNQATAAVMRLDGCTHQPGMQLRLFYNHQQLPSVADLGVDPTPPAPLFQLGPALSPSSGQSGPGPVFREEARRSRNMFSGTANAPSAKEMTGAGQEGMGPPVSLHVTGLADSVTKHQLHNLLLEWLPRGDIINVEKPSMGSSVVTFSSCRAAERAKMLDTCPLAGQMIRLRVQEGSASSSHGSSSSSAAPSRMFELGQQQVAQLQALQALGAPGADVVLGAAGIGALAGTEYTSNQLNVLGLPGRWQGRDLEEGQVRRLFEGFGRVDDVRKTTNTNRPGAHGIWMITFAAREDAMTAKHRLNGATMPGLDHPLYVGFAMPQAEVIPVRGGVV